MEEIAQNAKQGQDRRMFEYISRWMKFKQQSSGTASWRFYSIHTISIMNFFTMVSCVVFLVAVVFSSGVRAYIISCPTNPMQDQANSGLSQICAALEQAVDDSPAYSGILGDSNAIPSGKRVDHSFLRIGKRFHL